MERLAKLEHLVKMSEQTIAQASRLLLRSQSKSLAVWNSSSIDVNSTVIDECGMHSHQWLTTKLILISILGGMVGLFGVFGNISTVLIFTRPGMRTPNNMFLTALALFDTVLLITAFMLYAIEYVIEFGSFYRLYQAWLAYVRITFVMSHISQTGSVYITVAVTVERYLAVVTPWLGKRCCQQSGSIISIIGVSLFAIAFNCTKYYEVVVVRNEYCARGTWQAYVLQPGPIASSQLYQTVYSLYLSNIIMVFLPFLLLLFGNFMIAITIRRSVRQRRWTTTSASPETIQLKEKSREATIVLVVIVCIFLICNFWGFVIALLERVVGQERLIKEYTIFYAFSRETINFLAIVNSSINFVIYCIFGKDFRQQLCLVYGCGLLGDTNVAVPVATDKFEPWRHQQPRQSLVQMMIERMMFVNNRHQRTMRRNSSKRCTHNGRTPLTITSTSSAEQPLTTKICSHDNGVVSGHSTCTNELHQTTKNNHQSYPPAPPPPQHKCNHNNINNTSCCNHQNKVGRSQGHDSLLLSPGTSESVPLKELTWPSTPIRVSQIGGGTDNHSMCASIRTPNASINPDHTEQTYSSSRNVSASNRCNCDLCEDQSIIYV